MDLKRSAGTQLTKDDPEPSISSTADSWKAADSETLSSRRIVKLNVPHVDSSFSTSHDNPFAKLSSMAAPTSTGFGFRKPESLVVQTPLEEGKIEDSFGVASGNTERTSGALCSRSFGQKSEANATNPLPVLTIPSPKSPKHNPFSNPSPVSNPFMSIVESKDELWNTVARSASNAASTTVPVPWKRDSKVESSDVVTEAPAEKPCIIIEPSVAVSRCDDSVPKAGDVVSGKDEVKEATSTSTGLYGKVYTLKGDAACRTGEEGEDCLLQLRAKLFKLSSRIGGDVVATSQAKPTEELNGSQGLPSSSAVSSKPSVEAVLQSAVSVASPQSSVAPDWVEVGVGPVKVLSSSSAGNVSRLVMRRESKQGGSGTKLLLNVVLRRYVSVTKVSEKMLRLSCMYSDGESTQLVHGVFLFKTKLVQETDQLYEEIQRSVSADQTAQLSAPPPSSPSPSSSP